MRIRVIPCLLLHKGGLIKSVRFKDYKYIGDPLNAVKIFNEKEVDEIAILDIDATRDNRPPDIRFIAEIAGEAFMPLSYGGGISTLDQIKEIFYNGVEKIIINNASFKNPKLISEAAYIFGSQSIVVSIDVKKTIFGGNRVFIQNGKKNTGATPLSFAKLAEEYGAGEILLNSIDKDGTFSGYDLSLIKEIACNINVPVIALGGASSTKDFLNAIEHGASAVAAGSLFIYQGQYKGVLINYPAEKEMVKLRINTNNK